MDGVGGCACKCVARSVHLSHGRIHTKETQRHESMTYTTTALSEARTLRPDNDSHNCSTVHQQLVLSFPNHIPALSHGFRQCMHIGARAPQGWSWYDGKGNPQPRVHTKASDTCYCGDDNVAVSNGVLTLTNRREESHGFNYTSGVVNSIHYPPGSGRGFERAYGYFEARIKPSPGKYNCGYVSNHHY